MLGLGHGSELVAADTVDCSAAADIGFWFGSGLPLLRSGICCSKSPDYASHIRLLASSSGT